MRRHEDYRARVIALDPQIKVMALEEKEARQDFPGPYARGFRAGQRSADLVRIASTAAFIGIVVGLLLGLVFGRTP